MKVLVVASKKKRVAVPRRKLSAWLLNKHAIRPKKRRAAGLREKLEIVLKRKRAYAPKKKPAIVPKSRPVCRRKRKRGKKPKPKSVNAPNSKLAFALKSKLPGPINPPDFLTRRALLTLPVSMRSSSVEYFFCANASTGFFWIW